MCDHPRDLPVFYAPTLPVGLTDTEIRQYKDRPDATALSLTEAVNGQCVVRNACQYQQAGKDVQPVQSLGHSMNAVRLPKNQTVTYDFDCEKQGEALLRVAVIPTQPNDTGDLRFSVSIDGGEPQVCSIKEPFRSEQWKQNVLRGQAVKHIPVIIERKGKHQLIITALDHHVVIDQWMLDFDKERPFYVFPITPSY